MDNGYYALFVVLFLITIFVLGYRGVRRTIYHDILHYTNLFVTSYRNVVFTPKETVNTEQDKHEKENVV